ncbi:anti-sigma factor family protein [Taklimakanibacter lacteus]|uniref:anti-sigma factor family protein n=1 Tax=Taklimakanibacter lacteus TaxID=2268456 RepID=UPI000E661038
MTEPANNSEDWSLHAYADGEIAGQECRALDERLATDPEARAKVEAWRRQKSWLKEAFDPALDETVPPQIKAALRHRRGFSFSPAAIAAALALLLIGGAAGWFGSQQMNPPKAMEFADLAIEAHEIYSRESRHAVEVAANDSEHLTTWLSKRVGQKLVIPDLSARGYSFMGGRLLAAGDQPAAQFMYEDQAKRRITIFLTANAGGRESKFLVVEKQGVTACYWLDGPLGFVIAGETSRDDIVSLAHLVYQSFES